MNDYILRKASIQAKPEFLNENQDDAEKALYAKGWNACNKEYIDNLLDIPPADVRPVIPAQWIALDIYRSEGNYKCSHCEQPCYVPECMGEPMYAVCPNCGADMRPEGGAGNV